MNIQFIGMADTPETKGSRNWVKRVVTYKDLGSNKISAKTLFDFNTPKDVWTRLSEAKTNDTFSVTAQKNDKGYWDWTELARLDGVTPAAVETPKAGKVNTYEVNNQIQQERLAFDKAKQQLIIRQSCLASAVDLCKDHGKQPDAQAVCRVAEEFVSWVNQSSIGFMSDDIPE